MKELYSAIIFLVIMLPSAMSYGQCGVGEIEVSLEIDTDNYGYEAYWELVPGGNACGTGTIDFGGNSTQVGCMGGGGKDATTGTGYGDNTTVSSGPWCLTEGASYSLHYVDDWGDGGADFRVYIEGFPKYEFTGTGNGNVFSFDALGPFQYDAGIHSLDVLPYTSESSIEIKGEVFNFGADTITSLDIYYSVDGGSPVMANFSGIFIPPFTEYNFIHTTPWTPPSTGEYALVVWSGDINGNPDMDATNDTMSMTVIVGDPIPNIIDDYLTHIPEYDVIANSSNTISIPRDLDFHPILNQFELWVINKGTEGTGGSTVTISDAGKVDQGTAWKQDENAWHFMSLPTGIAFGENTNFATSAGVYDANHNGAPPFTGPTLWSSDPAVYAQPSGGNGSHLDMLHESPFCMGIAHEKDNAFWVTDTYTGDVVMYDFQADHGPGNDDHSDGIIRRYPQVSVNRIDDHIVCHLDLDKQTGWLYVVDGASQRVVRLDINTGFPSGTPTFPQYDGPLEEYTNMAGATVEEVITTGLVEPAGIKVMGDRLLVSDHSTGDIIIYDITSLPATELGRIETGTPGIMGITIGPEGFIWYVNATTSEVVKVGMGAVGVAEELSGGAISIYPNPSAGSIQVSTIGFNPLGKELMVTDLNGKLLFTQELTALKMQEVDLRELPSGMYLVYVSNGSDVIASRKIILTED